MCMFIDPEVVLANLLYYDPNGDNGVTYSDIERYCRRIKQKLAEDKEMKINCVSFQMNERSLSNDITSYPTIFRKSFGRFYKGSDFHLSRFDQRTDDKLKIILAKTAADDARV